MASQLRATWMLRLLVTVVAAVVGLLAWPGSVAAGATGTTVGPRPAATYDDAVDAPLGLADGRYAQVVADVRSGSTGTTRFLTVVATNTAKRGPKPFGVGPHNQTIASVADSVTDGRVIAGGQTGLPEAVISTPGGLKGTRRPDILVERADGSTYGINVGKQSTRTGAPITREAQAINDLEEFGGLEMHFVPYN